MDIAKDSQSVWGFFFRYIKRQPIFFSILSFAEMICMLDVVTSYAVKMLIDGIIDFHGVPDQIFQHLSPGLALYAFCWTAMIIVYRGKNYLLAYFLPRFIEAIRLDTFGYTLGHSFKYFNQHLAGDLADKVSSLARAVEAVLKFFWWSIIPAVAMVVLTIFWIAKISYSCAILIVCYLVMQLIILWLLSSKVHQLSEKNAEIVNKFNGRISDVFTNITSVKLFAKPQDELRMLAQKESAAQVASKKEFMLAQNVFYLGMDLPMFILCFGLFYLLIFDWQKGAVTAGDFAFVAQCAFNLISTIWRLGLASTSAFAELGFIRQSLAVLQKPHEITDTAGAKPLIVKEGKIEFIDLTFNYGNTQQLFKNKSITIRPKSKVGLVGFSGSGKTTFANLIIRLFDPLDGEIRIDDQNICKVTKDSLQAAVAVIPQETSLFHRSILENIRYGNLLASDDDVIKAAIDAHCHDFIIKLPQGYRTEVGERGVELSGGQRQRIAIARAILKKATILILDEATSALDSETEKLIQASLNKLMADKTSIIIAHRLSTLHHVDRILVFDKGHIVEDGSHESLLQQKGVYARLWHMQTGGFLPEVDNRANNISVET